MSMRSIIVGAFATSAILFTGRLALAEEPATSHYTAHHRGPSHRPKFFPLPGRFGPFGIHHRATDDPRLHRLAERGEDVRL
jgi:hypothetical protein